MKFSSVLSTVALLFVTKSLAMTWEEADAKAKEWCSDLTNEEKIAIVTGRENMTGVCVGSIDPIERKGFAGLCMQDGPAGVRFAKGTATSWQASINTAATFDRELLYKVGAAQGKEFHDRGINYGLGPAVGILRAPASGRIWESYGEDPFLVAECGVQVIKGMQDSGTIATVKHYIGNDQENNRGASSSNIPEQALWEVYMEPFYRAVKDADVHAVMSSYNAINGTYSVQNKRLLTDYLKGKLGYQGPVMSDWWSIYDVEKSFAAGMDINMPGGKYWGPDYVDDSFWGPHIQECIDKGIFPQERLDDAVLRIIRSLYKAGQMEDYPKVDLYVDTLTEENKALNRKAAADSSVLLKNEAVLPIGEGIKKIAIIGKDAMPPNLCDDMKCADGTLPLGWGSGTTDFKYVIDPLAAITERAKEDGIEVVSSGTDDAKAGAKAAKDADLAIVFVQADSGEEYIVVEGNKGDRQSLDLWHNGNELVEAVAAANKNTIVVIHAPGPVNLPFLDDVKGIIMAGMPGQETGNAIADVLFGDVNPSGHLPYTWAPREDYPTDVKYDETLPGGGEEKTQYDYDEGLFVGYRWFDKQNIEPTFPFGHGLSYTTFEYSDLETVMEEDGLHVTLTVTNTGDVAGAAVPMIFLSFPESVKDYPIRLFKGFDKVMLQPGEGKEVEIVVDNHALSYYDVEAEDYVKPEEGEYVVYAGSSAKDLPLKKTVSAAVGEAADDDNNGSDDEPTDLEGEATEIGDDSGDDDDELKEAEDSVKEDDDEEEKKEEEKGEKKEQEKTEDLGENSAKEEDAAENIEKPAEKPAEEPAAENAENPAEEPAEDSEKEEAAAGNAEEPTKKVRKLIILGYSKPNSFVSIYCISKELNIPPLSDVLINGTKILNDKLNNISSSTKEIMEFYWDRDMNSDKSIKAKNYKMYKFEESRNYLKLNLEYPEYSKGFRWILRARCGYKIDARVAKAAKMINNSCPNCCSCCFHCESYQRIDHWFINCFLFKNLRIDHFSDLDRNFFYFLDSLFNSLVRTSNNPSVDNRINNIVKGYKSSNNSISNIDILGSKKIVNRYRIYIFLIGGRDYGFSDRINNSPYKKEWECLFKCQTESGTYSKSPFLLRSAALLNDIMPVVCKRQHILFNKFKTNLSRNVNADNTVGQPSRANADPISDPSGIG
ncbi:hypothetical protein BCR32DRAFT_283457 [Anaeromyces robustus]|uniref:Probable beta-glucosidase G n=1 Tax=Anaeromyces robustus TaxID=1754192 RepID=A0A1Y1WUE3_9FUNG|nr:hypothetical protein BCR32DRAFT_283457 [Anaeromyces robustus]|eukprot:ORX77170.1 hypothetical protein BCR32DRAFT_283457 [Anaeromyces robustus]